MSIQEVFSMQAVFYSEEKVLQYLETRKGTPLGKRSTLKIAINGLFPRNLADTVLEKAISELERKGKIFIENGIYSSPGAAAKLVIANNEAIQAIQSSQKLNHYLKGEQLIEAEIDAIDRKNLNEMLTLRAKHDAETVALKMRLNTERERRRAYEWTEECQAGLNNKRLIKSYDIDHSFIHESDMNYHDLA